MKVTLPAKLQSGAALAAAPQPPASSLPATWTVLDVVRWTTARFTERALSSPRLDAELLIGHVLGLPRMQLYVQFERVLTPEELASLRDLIKRRQAGESVAYLVGHKEFWKFDFAVDARVLVPRPDTETLVEEAIARMGEPPAQPGETQPGETQLDEPQALSDAPTPSRPRLPASPTSAPAPGCWR